MPPAKKDPPTVAESVRAQQDAVSEGIDYYELPKALVQRIAKSSIPENSKLQKETVTALQKGSTVFINYLAATAHDIATSRQHKSVSASDVLKALEVIQFGDMVEPLQHELQIFRENAKNPKKSASANKAANASGTGDSVSGRSKPSTSKGKGKPEAGHGPSPLSNSVSAADVAVGASNTDMNISGENEGREVEDEDGDDEGEGEGAEEEEDELIDDVEIEEDNFDSGEEQEEPVDRMAVDEEEVKQDVKAADLGDPVVAE
ncbi:histone-fold-containing protein [Fomitiporia mediterranea MF3/22]|uniref:histone-fold-containing protein n=1 Tax=Fomitiporia mediterranea (strain MF3/22) TaxID=694068 RepID=UPI0004407B6B|nr:histone-fold-containing protein [Fomitiporia mediterranea MF3/22]EJC99540.1 histone-fold-containing protein [Fomitiporia mediterranea MF3/22]